MPLYLSVSNQILHPLLARPAHLFRCVCHSSVRPLSVYKPSFLHQISVSFIWDYSIVKAVSYWSQKPLYYTEMKIYSTQARRYDGLCLRSSKHSKEWNSLCSLMSFYLSRFLQNTKSRRRMNFPPRATSFLPNLLRLPLPLPGLFFIAIHHILQRTYVYSSYGAYF